MLIFLFLRQHRSQHLHNIALGGKVIRELTLDPNKLEQVLQYQKASLSKSVSTTFVTHCSLLTTKHRQKYPFETGTCEPFTSLISWPINKGKTSVEVDI